MKKRNHQNNKNKKQIFLQSNPNKQQLSSSNSTPIKIPNPKENQAHVIWEDEIVSKDNGAAVTTVSSILGPEDTKREMGKEGNSPARYPVDIKREKRKVKGRPIWAQLMCCSSVKQYVNQYVEIWKILVSLHSKTCREAGKPGKLAYVCLISCNFVLFKQNCCWTYIYSSLLL